MINTLAAIDKLVTTAVSHYEAYVRSVVAISEGYISDAASKQRAMRLVQSTHMTTLSELAQGHVAQLSELAHIEADAHLKQYEARDALMLSGAFLKESEQSAQEYLIGEVSSATERNLNALIREARRAALMGAGIRAEALRLMDAGGRRIPPSVHFRKVWRSVLRDHALIVYASIMRENGVGELTFWNKNEMSVHSGRRINIHERNFGIEDVEGVFHPNSNTVPVHSKKYEELTT